MKPLVFRPYQEFAPTLDEGHLLPADGALTRIASGDGFIYMRIDPLSPALSVRLAVSK